MLLGSREGNSQLHTSAHPVLHPVAPTGKIPGSKKNQMGTGVVRIEYLPFLSNICQRLGQVFISALSPSYPSTFCSCSQPSPPQSWAQFNSRGASPPAHILTFSWPAQVFGLACLCPEATRDLIPAQSIWCPCSHALACQDGTLKVTTTPSTSPPPAPLMHPSF